jgi:hypothetical protein
MLIESEDLKNMLEPYLKSYTIRFSTGDYIMTDGIPYFNMMKIIKECEKNGRQL